MTAQHTPGPWSLSNPPYDSVPWLHIYGPQDGNGTAKHIMHQDRSYDEKLANARLIAAAPDLLAALDAARGLLYDLNAHMLDAPGEQEALALIDAAIAKATGA